MKTYTYAAYEKGGEKLCIAMANSAKALGEMLGITAGAVWQKANGYYSQARSPYYITRVPSDEKSTSVFTPVIQSVKSVEVQKRPAPVAVARENDKPFSEICKAVRAHMCINQADFANILFSNAKEVSLMEHGYIPTDDRKIEKVKKIARRIGVI